MNKNVLMLLLAVVLIFTSCNFNQKHNETRGIENGHNYVDLGLPSGTKWATCNIGGEHESHTSYSSAYYAWGEIYESEEYRWSSYKYGDIYDMNTRNERYILTKYLTKVRYSNDGSVDNKTVLDLSDDVARVNWGGNWRIPTIAEWEELMQKCSWTWVTKDGVNGYEVKGMNGDSIFLPAAGRATDGDLLGELGYYWSSSLDTCIQIWARAIRISNGGVLDRGTTRTNGFVVRPVCNK